MTYAILTGNTITAHGPASGLWPDTSFGSSGPNAPFLAEAGAVIIRSDAAYNPATEFLQSCEPYVLNGEVFDTIAAPIIPPAPIMNWESFKEQALNSSVLNSILLEAYQTVPVAASALIPSLLKAENNQFKDFEISWKSIVTELNISEEIINGFVAIAEECNLPQEFINIINAG